MDPALQPYEAYPPPNLPSNNGNIVYDTYGLPDSVPLGQSGLTEHYGESDDEEVELGPQFTQPPPAEPFLSAQAVSDDYTEIQIGLQFQPVFQPEVPLCDNCRSRRKGGRRPVIYTCTQCISFQDRHLCKRCCIDEFSHESRLHKPTHTVYKWEPTWTWNLANGFRTPMQTIEMEEFVDKDLDDELREATFESSSYYEDRSIRIFVPAPTGFCRVITRFKVEPIESIRRDVDIVDRMKRLMSSDTSEVVGNIGAIAYPSSLLLPLPPRQPLIEPQDPPEKGALKLSDNLDLRRGDDFNKSRFLEVYAKAGAYGTIEVVLQDEFYRSEKYRSKRFYWKLESISVQHIPPREPPFASMGEMEILRRQQAKERQKGIQAKSDKVKKHFEAQEEERRKFYQEQREEQLKMYQDRETQKRVEQKELAQEQHNQQQALYEAQKKADEQREARRKERQQISQAKQDEQRTSSMPPKSQIDPFFTTLLSTATGAWAGTAGANAVQSNNNNQQPNAQAPISIAAQSNLQAPVPVAAYTPSQTYLHPQDQFSSRQDKRYGRGRADSKLSPMDAMGGRSGHTGRSTSPNWRANVSPSNHPPYLPRMSSSGSSGTPMEIPSNTNRRRRPSAASSVASASTGRKVSPAGSNVSSTSKVDLARRNGNGGRRRNRV